MILRPHALEWFWAAHILEQTKLWAKHHAGIVDSIRFSFTCSLCIPIHGCSSNTASLFVEEVLSWGVLKTEFRTLGWLSHGFCFLLETSMARNGNGSRPSDISGEWMNIICKLFWCYSAGICIRCLNHSHIWFSQASSVFYKGHANSHGSTKLFVLPWGLSWLAKAKGHIFGRSKRPFEAVKVKMVPTPSCMPGAQMGRGWI